MRDFQSSDDDSHSAAGYRKQAEEIRLFAQSVSTSKAKEALLKIAASYEYLADRHSKGNH